MDGTYRTSDKQSQQRAMQHRMLMCWENESCRTDAHRGCSFLGTLYSIRASGRKGVPSYRASRHVGADIIILLHDYTKATNARNWT
jgi:hypothetical protein